MRRLTFLVFRQSVLREMGRRLVDKKLLSIVTKLPTCNANCLRRQISHNTDLTCRLVNKKLFSIVCHSVLVDTGNLGRSELLGIDSYPSSCRATLPRTDVLSFLLLDLFLDVSLPGLNYYWSQESPLSGVGVVTGPLCQERSCRMKRL